MPEPKTYVIHAKTTGSVMSVGTEDPMDALKRAKEMAGQKSEVTITDRRGNHFTIDDLEKHVLSGDFVYAATSNRL